MSETYTFNQCYDLLHVDNKTFRSWLKEAGIDPDHQVSKADRRIRFLTREQLEYLASEHGRILGTAPTQEPTITLATFKLLADRVACSEGELARFPGMIEETKQALLDQLGQQQEEATERYQTVSDQLARTQEESNEQFKGLEQRFAAMLVAVMNEQQKNQDEAFSLLQQEQQTISSTQQDQAQHLDAIAQAITKLVNRVNLFETSIGRLKVTIDETKAIAHECKTRTDNQDRRMEELHMLLLEEREKREALERCIAKKSSKTNGTKKEES